MTRKLTIRSKLAAALAVPLIAVSALVSRQVAESQESTEGTPTTPEAPSDEVQALLNEAKVALQNKQTALAAGDWAAYGAADAQLAEIIAELIQLTAPTTTGQ